MRGRVRGGRKGEVKGKERKWRVRRQDEEEREEREEERN